MGTDRPTINEVDFCAQVASAANGLVVKNPESFPFREARVEGYGTGTGRRKRKDLRFFDRPIAIKDQLRHSTVRTTENFYIGSDIEYQREQIEKLILNSGKIVGNGEISNSNGLPTA